MPHLKIKPIPSLIKSERTAVLSEQNWELQEWDSWTLSDRTCSLRRQLAPVISTGSKTTVPIWNKAGDKHLSSGALSHLVKPSSCCSFSNLAPAGSRGYLAVCISPWETEQRSSFKRHASVFVFEAVLFFLFFLHSARLMYFIFKIFILRHLFGWVSECFRKCAWSSIFKIYCFKSLNAFKRKKKERRKKKSWLHCAAASVWAGSFGKYGRKMASWTHRSDKLRAEEEHEEGRISLCWGSLHYSQAPVLAMRFICGPNKVEQNILCSRLQSGLLWLEMKLKMCLRGL